MRLAPRHGWIASRGSMCTQHTYLCFSRTNIHTFGGAGWSFSRALAPGPGDCAASRVHTGTAGVRVSRCFSGLPPPPPAAPSAPMCSLQTGKESSSSSSRSLGSAPTLTANGGSAIAPSINRIRCLAINNRLLCTATALRLLETASYSCCRFHGGASWPRCATCS